MTKARKRRNKSSHKGQSAAVAADIWEDRPDKARPTPERRKHGAWRLVDGEDAGVTVAVDEGAHILDRLHAAGLIDADQRQGGLDLAALLDRTRLVSSGRSCLDMEPVGYEGDYATAAEEHDADERRMVYLTLGTFTFHECRRVCQEQLPPRDMDRLRRGLDLCAQFFGGGRKKLRKAS